MVDLLSQYEDQDHCPGDFPIRPPTTNHFHRPLSVTDTRSPVDSMHAVMAARVAEEEQAQRVMMSLNDTKPSYPLRTQEEVGRVLEEVHIAIKLTHAHKLVCVGQYTGNDRIFFLMVIIDLRTTQTAV